MALQRKPIPAEGDWLLTDHDGRDADEWLFKAIKDLSPLGFRGTPYFQDGVWGAEIGHADPYKEAVSVSVGQWLVLDGGVLKAMSVEQCEAMYDEVP